MAFDANQCVFSGKGVERNLFLLSNEMGREDRFTASLHLIFELIPDLGQAYTNAILKQAGKPPAHFIKSVDHPIFGGPDQPDLAARRRILDSMRAQDRRPAWRGATGTVP